MPQTGRRWARWATVLTTVLLVVPALGQVGGGAGFGGEPASAQTARPNIVLILTDDGSFRDFDDSSESDLRRFPNLKRLRDEGASFTDAWVTLPICCQSRASLLRGQYVHNHGVFFIAPPNGGFQEFYRRKLERSTVATWVRAAGYQTALIGKYLNFYPGDLNPKYTPPPWGTWVSAISGKFFNYQQNVNGKVVERGNKPRDYQTDVESRFAAGFVRANAAAGRPFFLHLSPRAPHGPAIPAPRHRAAFPDAQAARVDSYNEADMSDKPAWARSWPPMSAARQAQLDAWERRRLQSLLAVDDMLGSIFANLAATNQLDNTYIFFTSDNGYLMGEHRMEAKGFPYEESVRVPLIVRGPGIAPGSTIAALTTNADLAPTFAEIAGGPIPAFVDGRSLVPVFDGVPPENWRNAMLGEYFVRARRGRPGNGNNNGKPNKPGKRIEPTMQVAAKLDEQALSDLDLTKAEAPPGYVAPPTWAALRADDYVYIEYATGEKELYDLAEDEYQLDNLAAQDGYRDEMQTLATRLAELRACRGAGPEPTSCRTVENKPLPTLDPAADPPTTNGNRAARRTTDDRTPPTAIDRPRREQDRDPRPDRRPDRDQSNNDPRRERDRPPGEAPQNRPADREDAPRQNAADRR